MTTESPSSSPRKEVPEIPREVAEDVPANSAGSRAGQTQADLPAGSDPAAEQRRWLEKMRHYFAMIIAFACLVLVTLMAAVTYIWPRGDPTIIRETIDVMKILATASLGFIFGQALGRND